MSKLQATIKPHPATTASDPVWLAIVTTPRGRSYFASYTGYKPEANGVIQAFRVARRDFQPYFGS